MKLFDPTKPVRTRDGRPAVIHARNLRGAYSILATVYNPEIDSDEAYCYLSSGRLSNYGEGAPGDLVNTPRKFQKEVWINLYPGDICSADSSKAKADLLACSNRIACKRFLLEFEEGEGL